MSNGEKIIGQLESANQYIAKTMEFLAIFSVGTIGVVVVLNDKVLKLKSLVHLAFFFFILTILCVFIWFNGKAKQHIKVAKGLRDNPNSIIVIDESIWAKGAKIFAYFFYFFANILLYFSISIS